MKRVLLLAAASAAMLNRGAGAGSHSAYFVDAAPEAGIAFTHTSGAAGRYYLIETMGAGGGFLDYDLDGRLDIYLVDGFPLRGIGEDLQPVNLVDETADHYFVRETGAGRHRDADSLVALVRQGGPAPLGNRLYRNRGDRFTAVTGAGDPGYGMGCATGDYDNDGDPDLYVVNYGPNAIFENRAREGGTFVEATGQAGVGDESWGAGAAFFDYDNDGLLDLYVVNYLDFHVGNNRVCGVEDASLGSAGGTVVRVRKDRRSYCSPDRYRGAADALYRNTGRGFEDASRDAGILIADGKGLGAVTADYDSDGDTDLYVANDGVRNFLFRNEGGRFREVGLIAGSAYNGDGRAEAGMGVDWGDYDADADYDLFVTNYSRQTNTLYRNEGGRFSDVTSLLGVAGSSYEPLGFGTFFFEADNDGDLDLFVANGHVQDKVQYIAGNDGISYAQPNQLFENRPEAGFVDVSEAGGPGLSPALVSRGSARGDYDNDGDLDILVTNCNGPAQLLRNDLPAGRNWLSVRLIGALTRDAVGSRIAVTCGGAIQVREVRTSGSYASANDIRRHFGLGDCPTVESLEIIWPDGAMQVMEGVAPNQFITIEQQ
ncbi:MAG: CRTAC1 family protein [Gemmatimonadetes bacterium]|nr:CRTAC1 family protein [Gemmatimonadota bacterium]